MWKNLLERSQIEYLRCNDYDLTEFSTLISYRMGNMFSQDPKNTRKTNFWLLKAISTGKLPSAIKKHKTATRYIGIFLSAEELSISTYKN